MLYERGANALLTTADLTDVVADATHLHLSGYTLLDPATAPAGRFALEQAAARAATTSVDAASAAPLRRLGAATFLAWIRGVDLLLANADEATTLLECGDAFDARRDAGRLTGFAQRVVVKLGAAGAVWAQRNGSFVDLAAEPKTAVDPTGAGDAFAAGLLHAWLAGAAPTAALQAGVRLGGLAVSRLGGRPPAG
jgi:ribokinase